MTTMLNDTVDTLSLNIVAIPQGDTRGAGGGVKAKPKKRNNNKFDKRRRKAQLAKERAAIEKAKSVSRSSATPIRDDDTKAKAAKNKGKGHLSVENDIDPNHDVTDSVETESPAPEASASSPVIDDRSQSPVESEEESSNDSEEEVDHVFTNDEGND